MITFARSLQLLTPRKSAILGRSVSGRVTVVHSRRAYLPIHSCIQSDQSVEDQTENVEEAPAPEVPAPEEPAATPPEAVAENVVVEQPEKADGSSIPGPKSEGQKRRRRRVKKREVTLPLEEMTAGMELEGTVKSVTDYGAFIGDMGTPTDGLLHVSQLAAGYVEKVTDVVNVGEKLKVRVLNVDVEKGNFSLTRKTAGELEADSQHKGNRRDAAREAAAAKREEMSKRWDTFTYDPEEFIDAKVLSVTDFGGFCQLINENGEPLDTAPTDGLIHISELSKERVAKVSDVLTEGQLVKVRITSTDRKRNRISMSLRSVADSSADEGNAASIAAGMASAQENQPTFKTSFELAFENARASASEK